MGRVFTVDRYNPGDSLLFPARSSAFPGFTTDVKITWDAETGRQKLDSRPFSRRTSTIVV
jgi:hypothetical protein